MAWYDRGNLEGREAPGEIEAKTEDGNRMSRITLVGCIFAAVLFLVVVGFFISHKPTNPTPNPSVQQAQTASPSSSAPESNPAAPATPPPAKTSAVSEAAASVPVGTHFAVDSGLFQDRNNADALAARMPQQYRTEITPMNVHGRRLYRVRTIVPSETEANALATKLAHDQNLHAHISRIHRP
jgi:cell division septation protein DedD